MFEFSTNFPYVELYLDRTIHICSYVEPYMDRTIHICFYVELYIMDRTIHICSYVNVAGGRGGSPAVAGGGDGDGGDGGGGDGDVPTTLPSGQTPGPSRPGTKHPVRGQSLTSMILERFRSTRFLLQISGEPA